MLMFVFRRYTLELSPLCRLILANHVVINTESVAKLLRIADC